MGRDSGLYGAQVTSFGSMCIVVISSKKFRCGFRCSLNNILKKLHKLLFLVTNTPSIVQVIFFFIIFNFSNFHSK